MDKKRKICVVTTSRADYGRMKPVMEAIQSHPFLELQVIAGSSLFLDNLLWSIRHAEPASFLKSLPWHIKARQTVLFGSKKETDGLEYLTKLISKDGFRINARLPFFLEGGNPRVMVKSAAFSLLGISKVFDKMKPDIVLLHGDRFEILPVAMAAAFLNIPVAHIEGGDLSGTIDNSVRHAVTKLAHIHFPVTQKSRERLIKMGEDPSFIFLSGSPIIDFLKKTDMRLDNSFYNIYGPGVGIKTGEGKRVDLTKPFLLILYHPVTTEYENNYINTKKLIAAVDRMRHPVIFVAPNIDAGSDGVAKAIKEYRDKTRPSFAAFFKNFSPEDFCRVLANAAVAVGNSSSFLREGAFLGTPAVLIGGRQEARERSANVIEADFDENKIIAAVDKQIKHGKYRPDYLFGDGRASEKIVKVLADIDLLEIPFQKKFYD